MGHLVQLNFFSLLNYPGAEGVQRLEFVEVMRWGRRELLGLCSLHLNSKINFNSVCRLVTSLCRIGYGQGKLLELQLEKPVAILYLCLLGVLTRISATMQGQLSSSFL